MLAFATVRHRWPSFVGGFLALALGVALLTATLGVYLSAQPAVPDRFAGSAVVVQSPDVPDDGDPGTAHVPWSPERAAALVTELGALPGVTAAVPDRSFYAQVMVGGRPQDPVAGDVLGYAWSVTALAPYPLVDGAAPSTAGEVALGTGYGLEVGERVGLLTATGPAEVTVVGTVDGPGIYLADPVAARLAPGVSVIGLVTGDGTDPEALAVLARAVAGEHDTVLTGDARTALEPVAHARTRWIGTQLLTVMAVLAAFAAVFVVASTFSLAAQQRQRELALLRAVGATPRQVRRLLLAESLLVGPVAAGCGAVLGALLAPALGSLLVRVGMEPPGFTARAGAGAVTFAVGTGLLVCLLGVAVAARRPARVRPLAALREAIVDRRPMTRLRWLAGGLLTGAGLALAVATPTVAADIAISTAMCSALALIAGLALLAPVFVPPVARAVTWPLERLAGATGLLVRASTGTAVRRTAATAAPVLLTVGFSVLVFGMVATMSPAFGSEAAHRVGADVVVRPDGVPGLSDAAVAAVPGTAVSALGSAVYLTGPGGEPARLEAAGVDATTLDRVAGTFEVQAGDLAELAGPEPAMVATETTAAEHGWWVGDTPELTFADGRAVPVRVVAMSSDASLPAPVLLSRELLRAHDPSALTDLVYATGIDTGAVAPAVAGLGGTAVTAEAYAANDDEDRLVWIFAWIMVGLSIGYTGIAVANTLMMATAGRHRDFAVLRRTGATVPQVLRLVGAETLLVVGLGATLGFAVALPALLGIRAALAELVERPVALHLPWPGLAAVVGACAVLALTASLGSTRVALRRPAT